MTRVTLICKTCGYKARRDLSLDPGCRGVHETSSVFGYCPKGHGVLTREDGLPQEKWMNGFEYKDTTDFLEERERAKKGK